MDKGNMNSIVLPNVQKAFGTVDHQSLIEKLSCYDIKGDELMLFRYYLQDRTQCCSVNDHTSTSHGMPQCPFFGLLLFIIYMTDLPEFVKDINITMYANDTSLHKAFCSSQQLKEEMILAFCK